MKRIILVVTFCFGCIVLFAQSQNQKKNIVVVTAHPDDAEGIAGGTLFLLRDSFNIHIVIASKGERGLSETPNQETADIRVKEATNSANYLGAKLHFLGQTDGDIYADKQAVDSLVTILRSLDPAIIFTLWAIDVPDHLAAHNMAIKALWQTGQIHEKEVYFGQAGLGTQTNQFEPDFFVDISSVVEEKKKLLRFHECQNKDDQLVKETIEANQYWGLMATNKFAEPFRVYYPLSNSRWKRPTKNTLLNINGND